MTVSGETYAPKDGVDRATVVCGAASSTASVRSCPVSTLSSMSTLKKAKSWGPSPDSLTGAEYRADAPPSTEYSVRSTPNPRLSPTVKRSSIAVKVNSVRELT